MKRIGLFVLVLMPAIAFGQTGSGQLGPLHLPFEFKVTVNGIFEYQYSGLGDSIKSGYGFDFVVKPGDTNYHISEDTIKYSEDTFIQNEGGQLVSEDSSSSFMLVFDTTTKTISHINFSVSVDGVLSGGVEGHIEQSLVLSNFNYNSTSIFANDSSLALHMDSAGYGLFYAPPNDLSQQTDEWLLSVSSIDLSGNFHPTTLSNPSGVAMPVTSPSAMSVSIRNGFIQCGFPSSDHPRTLEVYTPLGVRAATFEIPAGQSEISLPHLTSGLYFVRMKGNLLKVAVP